MTDDKSRAETNQMLFSSLVMMLSTSAMQQMGKLVNPSTRKAEVNLEAAQISIDMLVMLQETTKGNLDKDEERLLADVLSSLQMNYVETSQAAPDTRKEQKADDKKEPDPGTQKPEEPKDPGSKKDPKYHKSYGE